MRYAPDHSARTRARLVEAAAAEIRAKGAPGIALAPLMRGLGLTHGGFYAHFPSRDALVAAAIEAMFAESEGRFPADMPLGHVVRTYLSRSHRDAPASGCPVAALMSEAHRLPALARAAYDRGVARMVESFARRLAPDGRGRDWGGPGARDAAFALVSGLAGGLALARAAGPDLSDAILAATRADLLARFAPTSPAFSAQPSGDAS